MNTNRFKPLVILTGAGISAESGIKTFRDSNGLWEKHRIEEVATPEAFSKNPVLVHNFYNLRRSQLSEMTVKPNLAHIALAQLEQEWEGEFLIITQNVDDLHERAGSRSLLHMHGELKKVWCKNCDERFPWNDNVFVETNCPECKSPGTLRPDIVWFGEIPYHMESIMEALTQCRIFISIGTSGLVYPAADFAYLASRARRIEVNTQSTDISNQFDEHHVGLAGIEVPKLVEQLLI